MRSHRRAWNGQAGRRALGSRGDVGDSAPLKSCIRDVMATLGSLDILGNWHGHGRAGRCAASLGTGPDSRRNFTVRAV
ncbi:hypothetical protein PSAB6_50205 [Paraburkholderia sabiae]|nr:hypothetical protein PSAB6_50205 [Paraburkholderia sabiae]